MALSSAQYLDKDSTQTLREGIAEYYACNPHVTLPDTQPEAFAKVLSAHDTLHVIYGLDTSMYDELKLLPLSWWTSKCSFQDYLRMKNTPAVDVMYKDMVRTKGALWLYTAVLRTLPRLVPNLLSIWVKTRMWPKRVPFFDYEPLLDRSLLEIRQDYGLCQFIRRRSSDSG